MDNDRTVTPLGVDALCLDRPISHAHSAGKGTACLMCGTRVATTVLAVVEGRVGARAVVLLLPCGCVPRMWGRLTPDAIAALTLAL